MMREIGATPLIAAISGFLCIALGAFGAHAVKDAQAKDWIETGVHFQFMHTMAAFASVSFRNWGAWIARGAPPFFFLGIACFSGSLYAMGFGYSVWPLLAPIGGAAFMLGWAVLIAAGVQAFLKERRS
ncbi:MAG: DUF423 domain-containing protein [Alphaproteobacteria bacterium]|nr:DUF423 domain-containing protein [Alphaproteobacteria bacterium]